MSRPLRIEYSKTCYHVINRGNNRRVVFAGPEDYALFLKKLGSFSELANIDRIIDNAESEFGRVLILSSLNRS